MCCSTLANRRLQLRPSCKRPPSELCVSETEAVLKKKKKKSQVEGERESRVFEHRRLHTAKCITQSFSTERALIFLHPT